MTERRKKTLAAVALSACMAICVGAAVGVNVHANFVSASADTAKYTATEDLPDWGSQTVSATNSATLNYSGVTVGQYVLNVKVTSGSTFASMTATVNGGQTTYLSYNGTTQTFYGVVTIGNASGSIVLATDSEDALTVEPALVDLYIGSATDYALGGLTLSASSSLSIKLDGVTAGNYEVLVDLGTTEFVAGENVSAGVDGVLHELELDGNYYSAYSGTVTVTDASTYLNIDTDSVTPVSVTVILTRQIEIAPLPVTGTTLEMWTAVTYSYTASSTGYYAISATSTDSEAQVSLTFKTEADSYDGLYVPDTSYPLYMEQDVKYYVEAVLTNSSNNESAEVAFSVVNWTVPTVEADNAVYVPVTSYGASAKWLTLDVEPATYNLSIKEVPFSFYMTGVTVTAHIGNETEIYLDSTNNYASEVEITSADTTISFTSSSNEYVALSVSLVIPEVRNTIGVNTPTPTPVTVPAAVSGEPSLVAYYVEDAGAGYYTVTIQGLVSDNIKVFTSTSDEEIIGFEGIKGSFVLKYYAYDFSLIFANYGGEETSFTATVSKTYETVSLGQNELTVQAGQTDTYFFEGLAAGDFALAVNDGNIAVAVEGVAVTGNAFTVTESQDNDGLVTVTFKNNGSADSTFSVTVTPKDTMELGTLTTYAVEGESQYMAYYIANVPAGKYSVTLVLPEDMQVMVTGNGNYAVYYGLTTGTFEVEETGYVALRFNCSNYGEGTEFKVLVKAIAGNMQLGAAQGVSLSSTDVSAAYTLTGLVTGEYTLSVLPEGVTAYVNGNAVENGTFSIWGDSCVITFVYSGVGGASFSATVTPANLLTLGETEEVTIGAWTYTKTYFVALSAGDYEISLTTGSVNVQVQYNGEELIAYDGDYAEFTVVATEGETTYIALTFNVQTYEAVTFSVKIEEG